MVFSLMVFCLLRKYFWVSTFSAYWFWPADPDLSYPYIQMSKNNRNIFVKTARNLHVSYANITQLFVYFLRIRNLET